VANEIREAVERTVEKLKLMNPDDVSRKEAPDEWSKKEVLGHLIDSAANNHQRFVRACCGAAETFPPYAQEDWVRVQRYDELDWGALVALWSAYNRHLCDVIERIPPDALSAPCNVGREESVTLEFVVRDYLRHLQHHLRTIVEE